MVLESRKVNIIWKLIRNDSGVILDLHVCAHTARFVVQGFQTTAEPQWLISQYVQIPIMISLSKDGVAFSVRNGRRSDGSKFAYLLNG